VVKIRKLCLLEIEQSDLVKMSEKTGIIDFIRVIDAMPSFEKIEFGVDDIVRSGLSS
jgi:hypothetical protein